MRGRFEGVGIGGNAVLFLGRCENFLLAGKISFIWRLAGSVPAGVGAFGGGEVVADGESAGTGVGVRVEEVLERWGAVEEWGNGLLFPPGRLRLRFGFGLELCGVVVGRGEFGLVGTRV